MILKLLCINRTNTVWAKVRLSYVILLFCISQKWKLGFYVSVIPSFLYLQLVVFLVTILYLIYTTNLPSPESEHRTCWYSSFKQNNYFLEGKNVFVLSLSHVVCLLFWIHNLFVILCASALFVLMGSYCTVKIYYWWWYF